MKEALGPRLFRIIYYRNAVLHLEEARVNFPSLSESLPVSTRVALKQAEGVAFLQVLYGISCAVILPASVRGAHPPERIQRTSTIAAKLASPKELRASQRSCYKRISADL